MTSFEAFTGGKPSFDKMHKFGSACYAYIENKKKLDDRAEKGIFVSFDISSPAHLIYKPSKGEIKKTRCVQFIDEESDSDYIMDDIFNRTYDGQNSQEIKSLGRIQGKV